MSAEHHTGRPASAPAYYLGRPADVWLGIARRRRPHPVVDREGARQQTSSRRPARMKEDPRLFAGQVALITGAALLASPLAGFCTGAYLPANGGVIMP